MDYLYINSGKFIFSVQNYFYLDDNGIHYRSLLSFHETEYKWNEITEVHIVYRNHSGTTGLYQYKFEARDGRKVTIPNNNKIDENKRRIEEKIGEFHILVKDNFKNPITD